MTLLSERPSWKVAPDQHDPRASDDPTTEAVSGRGIAALVGLGVLLVLGTSWFAFVMPATPGRRARNSGPLIDHVGAWRFLADHAPLPTGAHGLGLSIIVVGTMLFAAYAGAIRIVWHRHSRAALTVLCATAGACMVVSVLALPTHTSDIYDYALFARVPSEHGGQPYRDVPDQYRADPIYPYASHQYTGKPDNKLPVWLGFSVVVTKVAGDGPVANLLAFRLALGALSIGCIGLLLLLIRRVRPEATLSALAVLALNPILLVYSSSKTDSLMMFLLLASLLLLAKGHTKLTTVGLTLSSLVKLITLPVLAVHLIRRLVVTGRRAVFDGILVLAVCVAVYLSFAPGWDLVRSQIGLMSDSGSSLPSAVRPVASIAFVLVTVATAVRPLPPLPARGPAAEALALASRCVPVTLFFAMFLTRVGLPWYLLTAVAVAAVAGGGRTVAILVTLSWTSFLFGWWYSERTRAQLTPEILADKKLLFYVAPALVAVVAAIHHHRHAHPRPARSGEVG